MQTLCYLTDNTYDKNQVLKMERQILRTIGFDLNIVDVTVFMDKILLIESDLPKEVGVKSLCKKCTLWRIHLCRIKRLPKFEGLILAILINVLTLKKFYTLSEEFSINVSRSIFIRYCRHMHITFSCKF